MDKFLEPCPFCGSKARFLMSEYNGMSFVTASCTQDRMCGATIESPLACEQKNRASDGHLEYVLRRWNSRAKQRDE